MNICSCVVNAATHLPFFRSPEQERLLAELFVFAKEPLTLWSVTRPQTNVYDRTTRLSRVDRLEDQRDPPIGMAAMLANLLPGVRQLRAPLAAGYLWLFALWLVLEPALPTETEAQGLAASIYRLGDLVTAFGLAVVVSFAAYLIGSLSVSLVSWPSPRTLSIPGRRTRSWSSPLSPHAETALSDMAGSIGTELQGVISKVGLDVGEFLDQNGIPSPPADLDSKISYRAKPRLRRKDRAFIGPGAAEPADYEALDRNRIATAVARDLDIIETTRLLGRDQELYSAVDRFRAETEFRIALELPLLVLGIVIGLRAGWPWLAVSILISGALCVALFADAVKVQRRANDLLVDVLTDGRVQSPTVERLRNRAKRLTAPKSAADRADEATNEIALAIKRATRRLDLVGRSEPSLAVEAEKEALRIHPVIEKSRGVLPDHVLESAAAAGATLVALAQKWVAQMRGEGFEVDAGAAVEQAADEYAQFLRRSDEHLERMRTAEKNPPPQTNEPG
jgi:hypothetical protein